MPFFYDTLDTPIGMLTLEADDTHLLKVAYDHSPIKPHPNPITTACKAQLQEYFSGKRTHFDVPLKFQGTAFQEQAWQALLGIPFGETTTYGQQAHHMGNPKAVRAVGAANGKNKINIVVPCHRIVGAKGALTGYGGGLERKQWLLDHEQKIALKM